MYDIGMIPWQDRTPWFAFGQTTGSVRTTTSTSTFTSTSTTTSTTTAATATTATPTATTQQQHPQKKTFEKKVLGT